jgi:hypothetical protein
MNTTTESTNAGLELTALKVGRLSPATVEEQTAAAKAGKPLATGAVNESWSLQLSKIPKDVTAAELAVSICALNLANEHSEACRQLVERQSNSIDSITNTLHRLVTTAYIAISSRDQDTAKEKSQLIRILGQK